MISHRITCTVQEPTGKLHDAAHIVSMGTGVLQNHYADLLDLKDVLRLTGEGHSFYTEVHLQGEVPECTPTTARHVAEPRSAQTRIRYKTTTWTICHDAQSEKSA